MAKETFYTPEAPCMWAFLQEPKVDPDGEYDEVSRSKITITKPHKEGI